MVFSRALPKASTPIVFTLRYIDISKLIAVVKATDFYGNAIRCFKIRYLRAHKG